MVLAEATLEGLARQLASGELTSRALTRGYLERIDVAKCDRGEPTGAGDRRGPRRGARRRPGTWAAARHPRDGEGQHRYGRSHADDGGLVRARGGQSRAGCARGPEAPRRRRRAAGQDEPERVGKFPLVAFVQRLERAWPPDAEPVRP